MPRSVSLRIRRPAPCLSAMAACGRCKFLKALPPPATCALARACTSGSSGGAKGSLSITSSCKASPAMSMPSQNEAVATSTQPSPGGTALAGVCAGRALAPTKRSTSSRLGAWPCTSTSVSNPAAANCWRSASAIARMARVVVVSTMVRPPKALAPWAASAATAALWVASCGRGNSRGT